MALTPNLSLVRVTGSFVDPRGVPNSGTVTFTLSTYLVDPSYNQTVTNQTITCQLVNGQIVDDGHIGVDLAATNDPDVYPRNGTVTNVSWQVRERLVGLPDNVYDIKLDYRWATFDLADRKDLAGNPGVGTGVQDNVGGVGPGGSANPGGGTPGGGSGSVTAHASTHAVGGSDPLTPAAIGAATAKQFEDLRIMVETMQADNARLADRVDALEAASQPGSVPPSAPTAVSVAAGDGQVIVSFSPPTAQGGGPVLLYRVTLSNGVVREVTSSPAVITGLVNGTSVTGSVTAVNTYGESVASATFGPVTPTAAVTVFPPSAPTNVAAVAGAGSATVSFTAPSSTGGAAIQSYLVKASTGQAVTGLTSPIVVTGLTNGVAVTFTVTAYNSAGGSIESTPSGSVTPSSTPSAPTQVVGTPGDGTVSVAFVPGSANGSAIIDYTVTASTGQTRTGTSSPIVVTGLANGTPVTFTVRARNATGFSAASAASSPVTPTVAVVGGDTPSAPGNMTVTVGQTAGVASVAWTAPAVTGSSAIGSYRLTASGPAGGSTATVPAGTLTYSWPNLTVGATYIFTVAAVNGSGAGPSTTVTATIPEPTSSSGSNLLSTQQQSSEGSDLSGFSINGTGVVLSQDKSWASVGSSSLSVGSNSSVANGSGVSYERIPVTAGETYQFSVTLFRKNTDKAIGVVLKWRDGNNNAISNTDLAVTTGTLGSTSTVTQQGVAPAGAVFCRVTVQWAQPSVVGGESFNLDNASLVNITTLPGGGTITTPGRPEQVAVDGDAVSLSATVQWAYNTSGLNSPVKSFRVTRTGADGSGGSSSSLVLDVSTTSYTFTNLVAGQTYTFAVSGINDAGEGPSYVVTYTMPVVDGGSGSSGTPYPGATLYPGSTVYPGGGGGGSTPTITAPGAPTSVTVVANSTDRKPTVSWTAPTSNGGAAISGYYVDWTASDGTSGTRQVVGASTTGYTYTTSFTASAIVTFYVRAVNSAGASAAGSTTYTFPAVTTGVPSAPASLSAAVTGAGEVTVTWTAPASNGGSAVTGYYAGRDGTDATGYGPWTTPTPLSASTFTQSFTQLVVGRAYTFTVSAVNAVGTGSGRSVTFTIPAPAATTTVTLTPGTNTLGVAWTLPSNAISSTVGRDGTDLNGGGAYTSGAFAAPTKTATLQSLDPNQTYLVTVRVTLDDGTVITGTASGKPNAASTGTGTNPLGFKSFTVGAAVTGAANGEFNRWIGKKHGQYSTWGGSDESPYWDGGSASKPGRPWGILGSNAEYGSAKEATLGAFDVDVASQFGPRSWVNAGNGTESGYEDFLRTRFQELKSAWGSRTGTLYYRPHHEFNGDWYGWSVRNTADQDGFRKAWVRMRAVWDSVMAGDKRFKLVWSPNRDSKYGLDVRRCWPGKAYADVIGVDYYDYAVGANGTEADWTAEYNRTQNGGGPVGIGAWQAFAKAEGVPLSLPEWGEQFGDNLFFLQKMKTFFDANYYTGSGDPAGKLIYMAWHNLYAPGGTVDPNATSGNFIIQQNGADYSGRPKASPFFRQYCQNSTYARWL